jgi:rRNA maturation protein Nop10
MSKINPKLIDEVFDDSVLDALPANDKINKGVGNARQAEKIQGRKRKDQSARMSGDNNIMSGKVSPNRGKAMPQISEKITGIKRSEETKKQIGATRKAKGLTNTWSGVKRPEQSEIMKDPARNKGAQTMRETMTCPHCGKTANVPNYKRWHGDNCKAKK